VLRLVLASITIALCAAIVHVVTARDFYVYNAEISGSVLIDADNIYEAAKIHELNILWVQPQQTEERIKAITGIKSAHVRCSLPARVQIEVEERKPAVMWRKETQGQDWWVDEEGIVLPYHGNAADAIFVVDSTDAHLNVGDRIRPDGVVPSVQQLAAMLPGTRIFYYQLDWGLSFIQSSSNGTWPVYVGDSSDLPRKLQVLHSLNRYFDDSNISPRYVDIRWADYPVYGKPGGKATGTGN
jgi:hypothetical protein